MSNFNVVLDLDLLFLESGLHYVLEVSKYLILYSNAFYSRYDVLNSDLSMNLRVWSFNTKILILLQVLVISLISHLKLQWKAMAGCLPKIPRSQRKDAGLAIGMRIQTGKRCADLDRGIAVGA